MTAEKELKEGIKSETKSPAEELLYMQDPFTFVADEKVKKQYLLAALKKVPFLSGLLHNVDGTGTALSKLFQLNGDLSPGIKTAGKGFQWGSLGLAVADFLRIPAIYIAAAALGEKPPISVSKNAQWAYAAVVLALTATAMAVPPAALPIALATTALGLGVGMFSLGKFFYERHQSNKALASIKEQLPKAIEDFKEIRNEARALEKKLKANPDDPELSKQFTALKTNHSEQSLKLEKLHADYHIHRRKIDKQDKVSLVDKGIGLGLGSLATVGLALTFVVPPVGMAILGAAAFTGIMYGAIRYFSSSDDKPVIKKDMITKEIEAFAKDNILDEEDDTEIHTPVVSMAQQEALSPHESMHASNKWQEFKSSHDMSPVSDTQEVNPDKAKILIGSHRVTAVTAKEPATVMTEQKDQDDSSYKIR